MADSTQVGPNYDIEDDDADVKVKVICLGDSAVGKSKLVERFLMDGYHPQQLSTYALTLFTYDTELNNEKVKVDFWDTAGQERFQKMHQAYYHQAHACILVFDIERKLTYKNLGKWYQELREYRPDIPCICVANKIDVNLKMTQKAYNFPQKHKMPFHFVSASDGTNVVKVFREAIKAAVIYKKNPTDDMDLIMKELEYMELTPTADNISDSGLDSAGNSEGKEEDKDKSKS
ncbi:rab-like protein 2A [Lineus longissimus]|uniref:rab-like protein 2A n=1 Tax=Lineus longissimus TaxID=88925 RepID=UPI002B4F398E